MSLQNLWHFDGRVCCDGRAAASAAASAACVSSASMSLVLFGRSKDIAAVDAGSICTRKSLLRSLRDLVKGWI